MTMEQGLTNQQIEEDNNHLKVQGTGKSIQMVFKC